MVEVPQTCQQMDFLQAGAGHPKLSETEMLGGIVRMGGGLL